jgi:membrane protein YqaA with SNARE-associated domain
MGVFGLFLLGIGDSSFFFLPFGNDLLLIALVSARRESLIWIVYVLASVAGSVVGVLLLDLVVRKMGEKGLEKFMKPRRIERLRARLEKRTGWSVFLASLLPPPFPFTAVVIAASALQCSRRSIISAIFLGRLVRFTIEALLALYFGRSIIRYMDSDVVEYVVYVMIAVFIIGSAFSIYKWMRRERSREALTAQAAIESSSDALE